MQASKNSKLLWDDAKFAKISSSAERLTSVFGVRLLEQAGIPECPKEEPLVVLDNACGTGVITKALQEILIDRPAESFEVTCADFADAMVNTISERIQLSGWTNTKALKADAQDTKLPSEHYTHIFTNFGPMLFPNASAMLSECNRMLQPHGVCAFTTWKKVGWIEDFKEAFDTTPDLPSFPTDDRIVAAFSRGRWSDEDFVKEQLVQHGFENIRIEAVPNTSVAANMEELRSVLRPILSILQSLWTDTERETYANQQTEDKVEKWFQQKYQGGPIQWHWIALVTTSNKSL